MARKIAAAYLVIAFLAFMAKVVEVNGLMPVIAVSLGVAVMFSVIVALMVLLSD